MGMTKEHDLVQRWPIRDLVYRYVLNGVKYTRKAITSHTEPP